MLRDAGLLPLVYHRKVPQLEREQALAAMSTRSALALLVATARTCCTQFRPRKATFQSKASALGAPLLTMFAAGDRDHCIMVCTDAAARGLDIPLVSHVVQATFAASAVDFLHRVSGLASTLLADKQIVARRLALTSLSFVSTLLSL